MYLDRAIEDRFLSFVSPVPVTGCWLWTGGARSDGYGGFSVAGASEGAHRFAYRFYKGEIASGLCVCHRCDVRVCVNPEHLFLGTPAENAADRSAKGRTARPTGEKAPSAVLMEIEALSIYHDARPHQQIADDYGVDRYAVYAIKAGKTWASVTGGVSRLTGPRTGTRVHTAKLTPDQVDAIRADPRPSRAIAKSYSVSGSVIVRIKNGTSWRQPLRST
jgi:hypothetical protein